MRDLCRLFAAHCPGSDPVTDRFRAIHSVHRMPAMTVAIRTLTLVVAVLASASTKSPVRAQGPMQLPPEMMKLLEFDLPEDPAEVLAFVGKTPILFGELSPKIEHTIGGLLAQSQQQPSELELKLAKLNMLRQLLSRSIQQKQMRESFVLDQVATESADKREDASKSITAKGRQYFFEEQLPKLRKKYATDDATELDKKLRAEGSSLKAAQREFIDDMLGQIYISQKIIQKPVISISKIYTYYQDNRDDYRHEAEARWEQLTVMKENFPTPQAAMVEITSMAKEAFYGGSMEAVARARSQEPFASDGGVHDWTTLGSLKSKPLEKQVFSIALNRLSEIIDDDTALHVIRVLERREEGYTPLGEVQDDIEKQLQQAEVLEQQKKLIADLRGRVPVWSMFPDDTPGAMDLPNAKVFRR